MNSSNGNDSKSIHDELIQAYLDGETSSEQEEQIRQLLEDPSFCERLALFALDFACLHELGQQGVLEQPQEFETVSAATVPTVLGERAGFFSRTRLVQAGMVLAVSLLLLAVMSPFWLNRDPDDEPAVEKPVLGQIRDAASSMIVRHDLNNESAEIDSVLHSGDTLQTEGPEGFATFVFHDGTTLVLAGDAEVVVTQVNGQKRVDVHHGDVDADVTSQPAGKPMLFVTSLAEARVMGTQLSISAETSGTTLSVSEGHVVMKRMSDGRSVDVRGGFHAVASPDSELTARPVPPVPNEWSADFENGLPDNWRIGQWVTGDLPEKSRGAVRSARWTVGWNTRSRIYHAVRSNRVTTGLFHVHDDTYLNFTYKLDQPGWFNLFIVVRRNDVDRPRTGNYAHKEEAWWQIPPGEWRTVSVPLTNFHMVVRGRSKDTPENPPAGRRRGEFHLVQHTKTRPRSDHRSHLGDPRKTDNRTEQIMPLLRFLSISLLSLFIGSSVLAENRTTYDKHVKPFLNKYCLRCHGPRKAESDFRVDKLRLTIAKGHDVKLWHEVVNKALLGEMPPKGEKPSPGREEVDAFAKWIHDGMLKGEKALASSGGKVVIRRMNRSEYLNTIRDLFGFQNMPILPGMLPSDASAFGFDTVGSAKTLDPGSLQLYINAAGTILEKAARIPSKNKPKTQRLFKDRKYLLAELESIVARQNMGRDRRDQRKAKEAGVKWVPRKPMTIFNNRSSHRAIAPADSGYGKTAIHVRRIVAGRGMNGSGGGYRARQYYTQSSRKDPVNIRYGGPGLYRVRVHAAAKIHDPAHLPVLRIAMAGQAGEQGLLLHTVSSEMQTYEGSLYIDSRPKERERVIYLTCRGDSGIEADSASPAAAKDLIYFESIEIEGPINTEWPPRPYRTVFPDGEVKSQEEIAAYVRAFASKAWRRPVNASDIDFAMSVYRQTLAEKYSPRESLLKAYQVILSCPQFLFITEEEPGPRPLDNHELASRLSYFLWSSMPDQKLLQLAKAGKLTQPDVLKSQARRMMADPKSLRFAKDFAGQWLKVREVGVMTPARAVFPDYNRALERAHASGDRVVLSRGGQQKPEHS